MQFCAGIETTSNAIRMLKYSLFLFSDVVRHESKQQNKAEKAHGNTQTHSRAYTLCLLRLLTLSLSDFFVAWTRYLASHNHCEYLFGWPMRTCSNSEHHLLLSPTGNAIYHAVVHETKKKKIIKKNN